MHEEQISERPVVASTSRSAVFFFYIFNISSFLFGFILFLYWLVFALWLMRTHQLCSTDSYSFFCGYEVFWCQFPSGSFKKKTMGNKGGKLKKVNGILCCSRSLLSQFNWMQIFWIWVLAFAFAFACVCVLTMY